MRVCCARKERTFYRGRLDGTSAVTAQQEFTDKNGGVKPPLQTLRGEILRYAQSASLRMTCAAAVAGSKNSSVNFGFDLESGCVKPGKRAAFRTSTNYMCE